MLRDKAQASAIDVARIDRPQRAIGCVAEKPKLSAYAIGRPRDSATIGRLLGTRRIHRRENQLGLRGPVASLDRIDRHQRRLSPRRYENLRLARGAGKWSWNQLFDA